MVKRIVMVCLLCLALVGCSTKQEPSTPVVQESAPNTQVQEPSVSEDTTEPQNESVDVQTTEEAEEVVTDWPWDDPEYVDPSDVLLIEPDPEPDPEPDIYEEYDAIRPDEDGYITLPFGLKFKAPFNGLVQLSEASEYPYTEYYYITLHTVPDFSIMVRKADEVDVYEQRLEEYFDTMAEQCPIIARNDKMVCYAENRRYICLVYNGVGIYHFIFETNDPQYKQEIIDFANSF